MRAVPQQRVELERLFERLQPAWAEVRVGFL
jgi:hypothetical protein